MTVKEEKERVEKNLDGNEITSIVALRSKINRIEWYMTDWCNYRCSYCRTNHENQKLEKTEYYIEKAEQIKNKLNKDDKYLIYLKGGEVSFLDLEKILHTFDGYKVRFGITTNLSNKLDYYANLINNFNIKLVASYHEQSDPQDFIAKMAYLSYIQKKKEYATASFIMVSLVLSEEGFSKNYQYIYDKAKELDIKTQILPLKYKKEESKEKGKTSSIDPNLELNKSYKTEINGIPTHFTMLQLPSVLKNFSPKGFKCQEKYYLYYNKDHFEGHRCQKDKEETTIVCKKNECDFCQVTKLWK